MNKVASVIQETMQKGRLIVSDRKLGKESYARLGEIYEEGFDRIGECVTQSGEAPGLSASWVKASSEIAKLREESPSDGKAMLRRYEAFFKEAAQLAGGMIGGSVGQGVQRVALPAGSSPQGNSASSSPVSDESVNDQRTSLLPLQFDFKVEETPDGIRVEFNPKGNSFQEIGLLINNESRRLWGRNAIDPKLLEKWSMKTRLNQMIVLYPAVKGSELKERGKQRKYLREKKMSFADLAPLAIAAGFYRLKNGYGDRNKDPGDLFQGMVVLARRGALKASYGLGVFRFGTVAYAYSAYSHNMYYVFAAGSPNFES